MSEPAESSQPAKPEMPAQPGPPARHLLPPHMPFLWVLPIAAIARVWVAWADQGIIWPDEIYQTLEQGHRVAFGYGFIPWEFQDGARTWIFPGILAGVLKLGAFIGLDTGKGLVLWTKTWMAFAGVAAVFATMHAARTLAGPLAALLAGVLATFFPPSILFSGRCMSEVASEAAVAGALALALTPAGAGGSAPRMPPPRMLAGSLAALAVLLRYQNGLIALGVGLLLFLGPIRADLWTYLKGAAPIAALGAIVDWITWGAPFKPFFTYVGYNLEHAKDYGTAPIEYYADMLWSSGGPAMLAVALGIVTAIGSKERDRLVVFGTLVAYFGIHSLIAHKELRFLIPAAPLAFVLAGAGLAALLEPHVTGASKAATSPWPRRAAMGAAPAALAVLFGLEASGLTFETTGHPRQRIMPAQSAWHWQEAPNRILWRAGEAPDLCGLAITASNPIWTGGFSYLHRDVPFLHIPPETLANGWRGLPAAANYVIVEPGMPAPPSSAEVANVDGVKLYRRDGPCDVSRQPLDRRFPH
jgi:hypothetical protein